MDAADSGRAKAIDWDVRVIRWATGALLCLASAALAQDVARPPLIEAFRARLASDVERDAVGGITAAVVVGERIVWSEGFGWADAEKRIPARADTIYRVASITKTVTGAALMHLVQRGVVRLDDPVEKHLPEAHDFVAASAYDPPVLLVQLAAHTSGLAREPWLPATRRGPLADWESRVIATIPGTAFPRARGAFYGYSNVGYAVLGLALSRAAHEPFLDLVEKRIFAPLGMADSNFALRQDQKARLAKGYDNRAGLDTALPMHEHAERGYRIPSGGLYSTVGDLARLIALLTGAAGDSQLDAASRAQMLVFHAPLTRGRGYGLGLRLRTLADGRVLAGHDGNVPGYTAQLAFDPVSHAGVVLLRNYNVGRTDLQEVAFALVAALAKTGVR